MEQLKVRDTDIKRLNKFIHTTALMSKKSTFKNLWKYDGKNLIKCNLDFSVILKNISFDNLKKPALINNILMVTDEPVTDYPEIENIYDKTSLTMQGIIEINSEPTIFALQDSAKRNINAVFYDFVNDVQVATDAHRLITVPMRYDLKDYEKNSKLSFALELAIVRILNQLGLAFNFKVSEKFYHAEFENTEYKVKCKIIDENYPNWKQVMPNTEKMIFTNIQRKELEQLNKLFIQYKPDMFYKNQIDVNFLEGYISYTSKSDLNGNQAHIPFIKIENEKIAGVYNARYMLDMLKVLSRDEQVKFYSDGYGMMSPAKFVSDSGKEMLIMPIRP